MTLTADCFKLLSVFSKFLDIAISLYEENSPLRCQHTAIITYKGRIVSIGRNSPKTSPFNLKNPKYAQSGINISGFRGTCAESIALKRLFKTGIDFSKCLMYVIRVDNNKKINFSKPCISCISLLNWAEIKKVFYTNRDGNFEQL